MIQGTTYHEYELKKMALALADREALAQGCHRTRRKPPWSVRVSSNGTVQLMVSWTDAANGDVHTTSEAL